MLQHATSVIKEQAESESTNTKDKKDWSTEQQINDHFQELERQHVSELQRVTQELQTQHAQELQRVTAALQRPATTSPQYDDEKPNSTTTARHARMTRSQVTPIHTTTTKKRSIPPQPPHHRHIPETITRTVPKRTKMTHHPTRTGRRPPTTAWVNDDDEDDDETEDNILVF